MSLFAELKRRNVFRVAIAYLALAWLLTEVAGTLFPGFGVPDWAFRFVVIALALGFIPALVFSWAYEITPEGLKREKDVVRDASITHQTAKRLDLITISLIVVALVFIAVDRLWLAPRQNHAAEIVMEAVPDASQSTGPESLLQLDSIAVLPFANRSANPDDVFFVDGIHDDLLTYVSQIGSLKVISRTSVIKYRDSTQSIPEIAGELGVTAVLEGGVQRAGEQVRINVQLIDARTDDHIWSQIYDRKLTAANIFAIQSEIAESIAEALRASLTTEARQRIDSVPTKSLSALEEYFLGRQSVAQRKITEIEIAAKHFENAVELDPNFALAWVGLADTYILQWAYGRDVAKDEMFARSRDATDRALQIDPDLGEAYASVGKRRNFEGDPEGAEAAFKRAIQLNPNYAPAYQWYAEMLRDLSGRVDDALDMSSKAVERDPQSAIIRRDYGLVLENAGRYDESLEQYRRAIEIIPNFGPALWDMAFLQWNVYGRVDIAIACLSRLVSDDPDAFAMIALTMAYLELGDSQQAEAWLERSMELRLDRFSYSVSAMLHLHRGDLATAVEFAEKALEGPRSILFGWIMLALLRDSDFETGNPARSLARYELSYPELLNENGPEIDRTNLNTAIGLAAVHLNLGEAAKAERLLGRCQSVIETLDRMGWQGFGIADVHIHALRGDEDKALSALRQAVEEGWRTEWWFHLKYDTNLQSLRDESEFQALSSAVEADMAEQLRRVRDWGGDGEWPPLPGM